MISVIMIQKCGRGIFGIFRFNELTGRNCNRVLRRRRDFLKITKAEKVISPSPLSKTINSRSKVRNFFLSNAYKIQTIKLECDRNRPSE
ncbi:Uncharacterized protein dnm_084720 [Desulfonema magnum]|uniref:Uncharacterized protein n=1 Tax=Desulfonema magnum TaxID=45655 RepID=A0A975BVH6_9BACT|nr:Uncharacterized protein dnm_084720 [Desulfonema magnum]